MLKLYKKHQGIINLRLTFYTLKFFYLVL